MRVSEWGGERGWSDVTKWMKKGLNSIGVANGIQQKKIHSLRKFCFSCRSNGQEYNWFQWSRIQSIPMVKNRWSSCYHKMMENRSSAKRQWYTFCNNRHMMKIFSLSSHFLSPLVFLLSTTLSSISSFPHNPIERKQMSWVEGRKILKERGKKWVFETQKRKNTNTQNSLTLGDRREYQKRVRMREREYQKRVRMRERESTKRELEWERGKTINGEERFLQWDGGRRVSEFVTEKRASRLCVCLSVFDDWNELVREREKMSEKVRERERMEREKEWKRDPPFELRGKERRRGRRTPNTSELSARERERGREEEERNIERTGRKMVQLLLLSIRSFSLVLFPVSLLLSLSLSLTLFLHQVFLPC